MWFSLLTTDYHNIGIIDPYHYLVPDQQLFGGAYFWSKECGLIHSHVPDNQAFVGGWGVAICSRLSKN